MTNGTEIETPYSDFAAEFIEAIKHMANSPEALDNFESYLSMSFEDWINRYANTPENMVFEMKQFAHVFDYGV